MAGEIGMTKVGMTRASDYLMAKDPQVRKAGSGPQALADAKLQAANNGKDDLVLYHQGDVLVISAAKIETPTGPMPSVDDRIKVMVNGKSFMGQVKYIDQDSNPSAPKPSAAPASDKAVEDALKRQERYIRSQQNKQAAGALAGLLIKNTTKPNGMIQRGLR